jgi:hypothetical protein
MLYEKGCLGLLATCAKAKPDKWSEFRVLLSSSTNYLSLPATATNPNRCGPGKIIMLSSVMAELLSCWMPILTEAKSLALKT